MALYEVTRTDEVQPGEFVSAYVLARGSRLARLRVNHLSGVNKSATNVKATKIDAGKVEQLLCIYFDERNSE